MDDDAMMDLLLAARALARNNPRDAQIRFGLDQELVRMLASAPTKRLREIAQARVLLLQPRSTAVLRAALRGDERWRDLAAATAVQA